MNLLTTKETADMLKVSTRTVCRLVKRGELKCARVGKQMRFTFKEIQKYILDIMVIDPRTHKTHIERMEA